MELLLLSYTLRATTYIHTIPTTITTKKDKFYTQVQVAMGKTVHRERGGGGVGGGECQGGHHTMRVLECEGV